MSSPTAKRERLCPATTALIGSGQGQAGGGRVHHRSLINLPQFCSKSETNGSRVRMLRVFVLCCVALLLGAAEALAENELYLTEELPFSEPYRRSILTLQLNGS